MMTTAHIRLYLTGQKRHLRDKRSSLFSPAVIDDDERLKKLRAHLSLLSVQCLLLENDLAERQWEAINRKQISRWQHVSRLKASLFGSW